MFTESNFFLLKKEPLFYSYVPKVASLPSPHSQDLQPIPTLLSPLRECSPTSFPPTFPPHPKLQSHQNPSSLGHQVSTALSASSPTEAIQGSSLLHMCHGPWNSHVFFLVFCLVSENVEGLRLVDIVVIPKGLQFPSAPSLLPLTLPYWFLSLIQ